MVLASQLNRIVARRTYLSSRKLTFFRPVFLQPGKFHQVADYLKRENFPRVAVLGRPYGQALNWVDFDDDMLSDAEIAKS